MAESDGAANRAFDAIDQGQLLTAERILLVELDKDPKNQNLCAARAMYHFRNGDGEIAIAVAEELASQTLTSRVALGAVSHILQDACHWISLVNVLESHVSLFPNEVSVLENLILAYVRLGRLPDVQKRAMELFRLGKAPLHQVWAVMANLFIANGPSHLFLKIATKMLDTQVLKATLTQQTCFMFFDALLRQNLLKEAEAFVLSTRAQKLGVLPVRLENLYKVRRLSSDWHSCCAIGLQLWKDDIDNWAYFEMYLSSLQQLVSGSGAEFGLTVGFTLEEDPSVTYCQTAHTSYAEAEKFVADWIANDVVDGNTSRANLRGPYLAQLQLHVVQGKDVSELIPRYLALFSTKACCALDLSRFAAHLSSPTWRSHLPGSLEHCSSLQDHLRYMLRLKFDLLLPLASDEEARSMFATCVSGYHSTLAFSKELAWSEEGLCDGYITIALNVALRRFVDVGDRKWLVLGLAALSRCDRWKNNTGWLVFSVLFHRLLGLCDLAALRVLDAKNIQFDSMAHVDFETLLRTGMFDAAADVSRKAVRFYQGLQREVPLLRVKVFHYMSYPKLQEVEGFAAKLRNSIGCLENVVYSLILGLGACETKRDIVHLFCSKTEALQAALALADDDIVCNEDLEVVGSLVLGDFGGDAHRRYALEMLQPTPLGRRISRARILLCGCIACHDLCQVSRREQAELLQSAPKPKSGKKNKVTTFPVVLPRKVCIGQDVTFEGKCATDILDGMLAAHGTRAAEAEDSEVWVWCVCAFRWWLRIAQAVSGASKTSILEESSFMEMSELFLRAPICMGPFCAHLSLSFAMISVLRSLQECPVKESKISEWAGILLSRLEQAAENPEPQLDVAGFPDAEDYCQHLSKEKILQDLTARHREKQHSFRSRLASLLLECRTLMKVAKKK